MNDNSIRGLQWQKLIGQFFIPKFGGTANMWKEANIKAVGVLLAKIDRLYEEQTLTIVNDYYRRENIQWITTMFDHVGINISQVGDEDDLFELAQDAARWITPQVKSSYPGMIDIIHQMGSIYELFTASNEVSWELQGYLSGMGIDHLFSKFYGPDLLGAFKTSPYYYEQIVQQTDINPSEAVVIDDKVKNLKFAQQAGFHAIHSGLDGVIQVDDIPYFTNVNDLEGLLLDLDD